MPTRSAPCNLRRCLLALACYESTERQLQPLLKAPWPGVQQAASLEYDSGTCTEARRPESHLKCSYMPCIIKGLDNAAMSTSAMASRHMLE